MTVAFGLSVLSIFVVGFLVFHCGLSFFHAESNITGVLNVQGCVSGKTVLYSICSVYGMGSSETSKHSRIV